MIYFVLLIIVIIAILLYIHYNRKSKVDNVEDEIQLYFETKGSNYWVCETEKGFYDILKDDGGVYTLSFNSKIICKDKNFCFIEIVASKHYK